MITIRPHLKVFACLAGLAVLIVAGLVFWPGLGSSPQTGAGGAVAALKSRGPMAIQDAGASTQPGKPPGTQPGVSDASVRDIGLPPETEAVARWFSGEKKDIGDAQTIWQIREDKYIDFLKKESFVEALRRAHICSELIHVRGDFDVTDPDNPNIVVTLAKSRRFCKLLAYVAESKQSGDVGQTISTLQDNARWYLEERAKVEADILKVMADQPELFRSGVVLTERQRATLTDLFQGFGTVARAVPQLPMSLKGATLGLTTIAFLLGQTEDARALSPLLDLANRDDSAFLKELNRPGNRESRPCPTANQAVIADALDRLLVFEATRPGGNPESVKAAKEYLQWREQAGLPERKVVQVYAYDEPVIPYGLVGTVSRPDSNAKTRELALPMVEKGRSMHAPSDQMSEKHKAIIQWAKRLQTGLRP